MWTWRGSIVTARLRDRAASQGVQIIECQDDDLDFQTSALRFEAVQQ